MNALLKQTEDYIVTLFKDKLAGTYLYHNYLHTERVVEAATEIADAIDLSKGDKEILMLAAWFHDAGYIDGADNHEKKSCAIAESFLSENSFPKKRTEQVTACIMATKLDHEPKGILEEIIKDADTAHLAKKYYFEANELLRHERRLNYQITYSNKEWTEKTVKFFTEIHKYYTAYAVKNWDCLKHQNLLKIFEKNKKSFKKKNEAKLKAKFKNDSPDRSVQTLFRVSLRNHIKLSDIADTKANILLSVNAIIISLALANLIPKLDSVPNKHLMIPSLILVIFSVATIILSIISTRPKLGVGKFTDEDVEKRSVNLLFFGFFHKMSYEKYEWAIDQVLEDKKYIYHSLTKDLHSLGLVLKRKYQLLKITYMIFMLGIIISVIAFIIAFGQL